MADLSDVNSAQSVKIIGSDAAGIETNPIGAPTSNPALSDAGMVVRPLPYEPQTYSAVANAFVSAASATDVLVITGSATKTIRINKIRVSGTTTSGSAIKLVTNLIKRSAANTGGTTVADTAVPHDSANAAATATVVHYTANPSALGAAVGVVRSISSAVTASGLAGGDIVFDFADGLSQPIILRGILEKLAVNFNGTSVTGPVISIAVEWSEV